MPTVNVHNGQTIYHTINMLPASQVVDTTNTPTMTPTGSHTVDMLPASQVINAATTPTMTPTHETTLDGQGETFHRQAGRRKSLGIRNILTASKLPTPYSHSVPHSMPYQAEKPLNNHIMTETRPFNLVSRLQDALIRELEECHGDDLLSLSPLTSPESTPESSPVKKCTALPDVDHAQPATHPAMVESPVIGAPSSSVVNKPSASNKSERVKRRNVQQSRNNAKKRRQVEKESGREAPQVREKARDKYTSNIDPVFTPMATTKAPVANGSYIALNRPMGEEKEKKKKKKKDKKNAAGDKQKERAKTEFTKKELMEDYHFEYKAWEGNTAIPLGDCEDKRLIVILAGQPGDFKTVNEEAMACMEEARERLGTTAGKPGRRGAFSTVGSGVSFGGGQTKPMNFDNKGTKAEVVNDLNQQGCFRRIAGFQSSVFHTWAPKLYEYYEEKLGQLFDHDPSLRKPFRSVYPVATYNLGPRTVCVPHVDFANLPFGYCAITALGNYNHKTGGHCVLWECKLIIELPPGATILIPSAILTHFNLPVGEHETRYSFTQYAAGGLFRWVDNNFMTAAKYWATLTEQGKLDKLEEDKKRWEFGLSLLPTLP